MIRVILMLSGMLMSCYWLCAQSTTVTYTSSTTDFANPERGIYHYQETHSSSYTPLSLATLQNFRTSENVTLIYRIFYLEDFVNAPISAAYLAQMQTDFDRVRAAGIKCIVRFAYTDQANGWPPASPYGDATKAWMLQHIAQLEPYLQNNADVIAFVHAGFIGIWGEWYYTTYFGDPLNGTPTAANYTDRKEVLDRLLLAVPATRMIQVRTPYYKYRFYRSGALTPVSAAEAFNGSSVSRTGHHNDCFLASSDDFGTYVNTSTEYPYLAADTKYVPMGGETCQLNSPRSDCSGDALNEFALFHWTYINRDYINTVWNAWIAQSCSLQIKKSLGYRIQLNSGVYSTNAKPGGMLELDLSLTNVGWASMYNPRKVEIILKNTADGTICRATLPDDPRRWESAATTHLIYQIGIPSNFPDGSYKVYLSLPDAETSLYELPYYSVRTANDNVAWDATKGYNDLGFTLNLSSSYASASYSGSLWFATCYGSLPVKWLNAEAEQQEDKIVVEWSVTEAYDRPFSVERSSDGIHYATIGEVSAGSETEIQHYAFTDSSPLSGKSYYRIVQHDDQGNAEYSPVASVMNTIPEFILFPVPFTSTIQLFGELSTIEKVEVININGQAVLSYQRSTLPKEWGEELIPGVYVVKVITQRSVQQFKIIKE